MKRYILGLGFLDGHALAKRAEADGAEVLKTRLIKTGRNTALVAAFDEMPFVKTAADSDGALTMKRS